MSEVVFKPKRKYNKKPKGIYNPDEDNYNSDNNMKIEEKKEEKKEEIKNEEKPKEKGGHIVPDVYQKEESIIPEEKAKRKSRKRDKDCIDGVKTFGTKEEVFGGQACKTRGGLKSGDLIKNAKGKIVSKKKSEIGKQLIKRLRESAVKEQ